ncbi:MAG: type IX secretion system membrane protein PorP/SprF [Bacteroidales bacterium]|nr:type IX secretion system membrane protein PorP/SprF [Bacteroidales bacterium]
MSIQSRILKNSFISRGTSVRRNETNSSKIGKVGYGAYIFNDRNGAIDRTGMQATYSYHLKYGESLLSFGLSALLYQFKIDQEGLVLLDLDNVLNNGEKNFAYIPDANLGFIYTHPDFYGGLSISQLLKQSVQLGNLGDGEFAMVRHYNLTGGYKYRVNREFSFEPSMLLKFPQGLKPQLDLNAQLNYKEDYWGGLSYRTGSAIIIFFGIRFDKFYFGYAFDYTLRNIRRYTFGSHEFMMAVKLGDNARRYRWLNRY